MIQKENKQMKKTTKSAERVKADLIQKQMREIHMQIMEEELQKRVAALAIKRHQYKIDELGIKQARLKIELTSMEKW